MVTITICLIPKDSSGMLIELLEFTFAKLFVHRYNKKASFKIM